jgi:hypothetical protein
MPPRKHEITKQLLGNEFSCFRVFVAKFMS